MKKRIIALTAFFAVALSGCGLIDEANEVGTSTPENNTTIQIVTEAVAKIENTAEIEETTKITTSTTAFAETTTVEEIESVTTSEEIIHKAEPEVFESNNYLSTQKNEEVTVTTTSPDSTINSTEKKSVTTTTECLDYKPEVTTESVVIDSKDIFAKLNSLSYNPYTSDGLPEYYLTAPDGTVYQINIGGRWIWRNGKEEAYLTDDVVAIIMDYCNKYGLNEF